MRYFAEIGPGNVVSRVIVADSLSWCAENLGGWWEETYIDHPTERFAGPGLVYVSSDSRKFLQVGEE
jgi:hypothetical protein